MRGLIALALFYLAVLSSCTTAQEAKSIRFPQEFGQKAMDHVVTLVQLGPRVAGSTAERNGAAYLRDQFEKVGLDAWIEPFEFEDFIIKRASLAVCATEFTPAMIGFNPYNKGLSIDAPPVFVQPGMGADDLAELRLADHLVITTDPAPFFALLFSRPRAIAYLDAEEYASVADRPCSSAQLRVDGDIAKHSSANVVATVGTKDPRARELVLTAHFDSYRNSPGADDNGSGIGVLLELARYFVTRGVPSNLRIRFVALGAEELGVIGSRAYLDAHREEFARCVLLINLDQVGGPKGPYVEMTGGVSGVVDTLVENHFPTVLRNRAWEGMDGHWKLLDLRVVELFSVTNRPAWLSDLIHKSATAIGCEVIPTGNMGGDQQVFTQAGIIATSIGTSGNKYHSPEDLPAQVVVDQLAVVGRLAAEIACRAMEKYAQEKGSHD